MMNDLINGDGLSLLPQLRPAALPDRARGRQHAAHSEVTVIGALAARTDSIAALDGGLGRDQIGDDHNDVDSVSATL